MDYLTFLPFSIPFSTFHLCPLPLPWSDCFLLSWFCLKIRQEDARRAVQPKMNRTHPGETHTHDGSSLWWLCSSRSGCGFYCCHFDITYLHILFWQAGRYDESLKHLEGLQDLNKEDYKISMNEAIVKFYKSGQTTTGALKQSLMVLKNQVTAAQAHIL